MAVIQFLLGVDAPVSLLLIQQIFFTVLVNTLIALPGLRGGPPRCIQPALPADPAPPAPARVHDRRPQPAPAAVGAARQMRGAPMIAPPEDRAHR